MRNHEPENSQEKNEFRRRPASERSSGEGNRSGNPRKDFNRPQSSGFNPRDHSSRNQSDEGSRFSSENKPTRRPRISRPSENSGGSEIDGNKLFSSNPEREKRSFNAGNGDRRFNQSGDRERRNYQGSGDGERRNFSGGGGERRNSSSGSGERRNYSSGDGERRNYSSGGGERRNSSSGEGERRNYSSGGGERRNYSSGDGERRSYSSGGGERRNSSSGDGERRNYSSGGGERRNSSSGDGERRSYQSGDRERRPYSGNSERRGSQEGNNRRSYGDSSRGNSTGNRFGDRPNRGSGNFNSDRRNNSFGRSPRRDERPWESEPFERPEAPNYQVETPEETRLNKYLANAGICSRREADEYIKTGVVKVNDVIVTEMGYRVHPNDVVKFNDESVRTERKVYLLLNKPKDFVTTTDDPHAKRNVMELVENACKERIYPVGRLDRSTTGVLLFTNDGDLAGKLTHPSFKKKKIYHVFLDKPLTKAHLNEIAEGLTLDDGPIQVDGINYANPEDKKQVGVEIHSGRNRIVRRIFESLGYRIKSLDRVYFAGLTKKNVQRGRYRFLTEQEVNFLKMNVFK